MSGASVSRHPNQGSPCEKGGIVPHGTLCMWYALPGWKCNGTGTHLCTEGNFNSSVRCEEDAKVGLGDASTPGATTEGEGRAKLSKDGEL